MLLFMESEHLVYYRIPIKLINEYHEDTDIFSNKSDSKF